MTKYEEGAAAIGGLIYEKLSKQRKGLVLDFNPHDFTTIPGQRNKWNEPNAAAMVGIVKMIKDEVL